MTNLNEDDPVLWRATLIPHRSLSPQGFRVLITAIAGVSFIAGLTFVALGASPVLGFFGLDAVLIYWGFRASYRSASGREELIVTTTTLMVRKVAPSGASSTWNFNPLWVRLERDEDDDYGLLRLFLSSSGRKLPVAEALSPIERARFASALGAALAQARRGPTYNPV